MVTLEKDIHHLFLIWLILTGVICFGLFVSWYSDVLLLLFDGDKSRISWVISLFYLLITLHCAKRFYFMSSEINTATIISSIIRKEHKLEIKLDQGTVVINDHIKLPDCILSDYIHDLIYKSNHESSNGIKDQSGNNLELIDVYESKLKKPHDIGWFITDLMIKLGLLGTIVGFVLMLGSVVNVTDFDVNTMQGILKNMSSGMGTALYTTFAGLIFSILAGIQYHLLDHGADEIIDTAKHLGQVYLLPKLGVRTSA